MRHRYTEVEQTREMPLWIGDEDAPEAEWGTYTTLGPFVPLRRSERGRGAVYAVRRDHEARHSPRLRPGSIRKWAGNAWREAGEFLFGAFQPIREAM